MAKWKFEYNDKEHEINSKTLEFINCSNSKSNYSQWDLSEYFFYPIFGICKIRGYAPSQQVGKESDFTMLLDDGNVIKSILQKEEMPDPNQLLRWWADNEVRGFSLVLVPFCFKLYYKGDLFGRCSGGRDTYIKTDISLDQQIFNIKEFVNMFKKWTSLEEWWKFNKVTYCYMKSYGNWYEFAFANLGIPSFCIPKYWKIERQIKYVDTLIKLYKE